jgi:hypothetical protein
MTSDKLQWFGMFAECSQAIFHQHAVNNTTLKVEIIRVLTFDAHCLSAC